MRLETLSASDRMANSAGRTLKERRRAIQDAMKQGRSGELRPETIAGFMRDSLDAITMTLKTVTGEMARPLPNGETECLPLNHVRAQSIARQCVSVIDTIVDNRRLRAGLLERTDFTKGTAPALETSLAGGLVRHLALQADHDEITRNNHVLLVDLLSSIAGTEVARSFKPPSTVHDNVKRGLDENQGESRTRPREIWERIQRKLTGILAREPGWLTQSGSIVEERLSHGDKAQPPESAPRVQPGQKPAQYPYYEGCLATVECVERKIAAGLKDSSKLIHAGPIAVAVSQFPHKAGLDKHNTAIIRGLIEAIRSERETSLGPRLVSSLVQYAGVVRGEGFSAAGIEPHDLRKVITVVPYDQARKLARSLSDVTKYHKTLPRAMEARQVVELCREVRHILGTDVRHGGQRVVHLLETTNNPILQRKVLIGTLLQDVVRAALAPVNNDPDMAYETFNRLTLMAGNNLSQAGLTHHQVSGFAAHATARGWKRSLDILAALTKHSQLLDDALRDGRHKGHQQRVDGLDRRPRPKGLPHSRLFTTDCFGALDPRLVKFDKAKRKQEPVGTAAVASNVPSIRPSPEAGTVPTRQQDYIASRAKGLFILRQARQRSPSLPL
jgi:hypothetical protein